MAEIQFVIRNKKLFRSSHVYRHLRLVHVSNLLNIFSLSSRMQKLKDSKDDCVVREHESNLRDGRQNTNYASSITFRASTEIPTKDLMA